MDHPLPPISDAARTFRPGIYRHYKGGVYHALHVARDSEDPTREYVVYQSTTEPDRVWIRPLAMFLENVEAGEYKGPRFAWVRAV